MRLMLKIQSLHAAKLGSDREPEFVIEASHVSVMDDDGISFVLDDLGTYNHRTRKAGREFGIREFKDGKYKFVRRIPMSPKSESEDQ